MSSRGKKRGSGCLATIPANVEKPIQFSCSQEVLARWNDGLFYLGVILKVDTPEEKCFIRFEDDSEHSVMFKDIFKAANQREITCCECHSDHSESPNEIVLCDNCGTGYHQNCHKPQIGSSVLRPDVEWKCRICVFASSVKRGGALKTGPEAKALQCVKQTLPYTMSSLTWDAHHKANLEHCYCYCGGPGEWYMKMLQCCRCRQWFHEACIQCLEYPLVCGDRWYIFVCSVCNFGAEYLKRLQIKWVDIAQLAIFNLTVMKNKKYYDLEESIIPWVREHWEALQLEKSIENLKDQLKDVLLSNKSRFQSGREVKKRANIWGLRVRLPPPPPTVILPVCDQITDQVMNSVQMKGNKTKTFVPLHSQSPIPVRKRTNSLNGLNTRSAKARKLLNAANEKGLKNGHVESANQSYRGHNLSLSFDNGSCGKSPVNGKSPNVRTSPFKNAFGKKSLSLDRIIPRLDRYTGENHPFKTVVEIRDELEKKRLKTEALTSALNGYDTDSSTQCSQLEDTDTELSDSLNNNNNNVVKSPSPDIFMPPKKHPRKPCKKYAEISNCGSVLPAHISPVEVTSPPSLYRSCRTPNVVDTATIDAVSSQGVSLKQLKSSVKHHFGAADRLAKGEKYFIIARRVTSQKNAQYLIEWEGALGK